MAIEETRAPTGCDADVDGGYGVCDCRVETFPGNPWDVVVLHVAGEVDLSTHRYLQAALQRCLDREPPYLVADLSAVTFCGARGLALLGAAAARADARGSRFAVSGLTPFLDRVANLLWEPDRPIRHRSVAAAVTATRAVLAQPDRTARG